MSSLKDVSLKDVGLKDVSLKDVVVPCYCLKVLYSYMATLFSTTSETTFNQYGQNDTYFVKH